VAVFSKLVSNNTRHTASFGQLWGRKGEGHSCVTHDAAVLLHCYGVPDAAVNYFEHKKKVSAPTRAVSALSCPLRCILGCKRRRKIDSRQFPRGRSTAVFRNPPQMNGPLRTKRPAVVAQNKWYHCRLALLCMLRLVRMICRRLQAGLDSN